MEEHITAIIPMEEMLPAVSQGAIGIACREGDAPMEVGHQVQLVGGGRPDELWRNKRPQGFGFMVTKQGRYQPVQIVIESRRFIHFVNPFLDAALRSTSLA